MDGELDANIDIAPILDEYTSEYVVPEIRDGEIKFEEKGKVYKTEKGNYFDLPDMPIIGIAKGGNTGNGEQDDENFDGVNEPELIDGMIPIVFDNTSPEDGPIPEGWREPEDDEEWYNYDEKQWGNAVTQDRKYVGMDTKICI